MAQSIFSTVTECKFRETNWDAPLLRLSTNALLIFRGLHTFFCCLCCLICFVQIIFFIKVVKVHHGEDDIVKFVGDIEQITPEQVFYLYAVFFRVLIRSREGKIRFFVYGCRQVHMGTVFQVLYFYA